MHYTSSKKFPLSNVLLKNVACLSPLVRKHPKAVQMIGAFVACLPHLNSEKMKDDVLHKWQTYQEDEIPEDMYIYEQGQKSDGTAYVKYRRVDEYWYRVMQLTDTRGNRKYPALTAIVKMTLSL